MAKPKAAKSSGKKSGGAKRGGTHEMVVVASKVKSAIRAKGYNSAADVLDGLNEVVHFYIEKATRRAGDNKRKTVRRHDFW